VLLLLLLAVGVGCVEQSGGCGRMALWYQGWQLAVGPGAQLLPAGDELLQAVAIKRSAQTSGKAQL